jgi:DNA-binding MarR family transcriptional regulator
MTSTEGLGASLRRLIAALDGGAQQVYDGMGVDFRPRYFPIARHLLEQGPTPVSQLSELLRMTQPATSQTLREMERDGLVQFKAGEDRRVRLAELTTKGLSLCRRLEPVWKAAAESASDLGAETGIDIAAMVSRLLAALEQRSFAIRIEERLK